jgi:hypothetical protein
LEEISFSTGQSDLHQRLERVGGRQSLGARPEVGQGIPERAKVCTRRF